MPEQTQFSIKTIRELKFICNNSNGYLNIFPYLKKHNKTIDQWVKSDNYTKLLLYNKNNEYDIQEIKDSNGFNGYYINPDLLYSFLSWISNDYSEMLSYIRIEQSIIFWKKMNDID